MGLTYDIQKIRTCGIDQTDTQTDKRHRLIAILCPPTRGDVNIILL